MTVLNHGRAAGFAPFPPDVRQPKAGEFPDAAGSPIVSRKAP
jgi:hypothetical protein